jgi:hypothetical protein
MNGPEAFKGREENMEIQRRIDKQLADIKLRVQAQRGFEAKALNLSKSGIETFAPISTKKVLHTKPATKVSNTHTGVQVPNGPPVKHFSEVETHQLIRGSDGQLEFFGEKQ